VNGSQCFFGGGRRGYFSCLGCELVSLLVFVGTLCVCYSIEYKPRAFKRGVCTCNLAFSSVVFESVHDALAVVLPIPRVRHLLVKLATILWRQIL
jgi:hypothetical protein